MAKNIVVCRKVSLSVVAFILAASSAQAQTGPTGTGNNASGGGTTVQAVPSSTTAPTGSADPTSAAAADSGQLGISS
jgi:hypothetical protein